MNSVIRWIETEFIHVSLDSRKKKYVKDSFWQFAKKYTHRQTDTEYIIKII
jgi:hypothetical protein